MNKNIELFNRYKDGIINLKLWEYKPIDEPFVLWAKITDKKMIQEIFKEINPNEIIKISTSDKEMDIDVSKSYFYRLIKGKNIKYYIV
ncbi:hypothetical protein [Paratissierella segnis]|jgi:hypothetical protein|uniref:Uncharacterized protein n=1 Tax=Paratissierella segnis TaxID=2763679 RepID=A0A926IJC6_9FIRM|nr:hypothetical protein [Paratissierella segnis]MBC8587100.1 hypothetical protein [Paratissierella segnis]